MIGKNGMGRLRDALTRRYDHDGRRHRAHNSAASARTSIGTGDVTTIDAIAGTIIATPTIIRSNECDWTPAWLRSIDDAVTA